MDSAIDSCDAFNANCEFSNIMPCVCNVIVAKFISASILQHVFTIILNIAISMQHANAVVNFSPLSLSLNHIKNSHSLRNLLRVKYFLLHRVSLYVTGLREHNFRNVAAL